MFCLSSKKCTVLQLKAQSSPHGSCSHVVLWNVFLLVFCLYNPASPTNIFLTVGMNNCFWEKKERKSDRQVKIYFSWSINAFYRPFLNAARPQSLVPSGCFGEPGQTSYLGAIFILNTIFNLLWNKARNTLKIKTINCTFLPSKTATVYWKSTSRNDVIWDPPQQLRSKS